MNKIILSGNTATIQNQQGEPLCTIQAPQGVQLQCEVLNRGAFAVENQNQPANQAREGGGDATGQGQQIMQ